jgi:hypothetical protein
MLSYCLILFDRGIAQTFVNLLGEKYVRFGRLAKVEIFFVSCYFRTSAVKTKFLKYSNAIQLQNLKRVTFHRTYLTRTAAFGANISRLRNKKEISTCACAFIRDKFKLEDKVKRYRKILYAQRTDYSVANNYFMYVCLSSPKHEVK